MPNIGTPGPASRFQRGDRTQFFAMLAKLLHGFSGAAHRRIVLIALDTVAVTLVQVSDNEVLFQGTLVRGESRSFPKRGDLYLTASALEDIEIEMNQLFAAVLLLR